MTQLVVDDVTVRYGDAIALDRFSLAVESGLIAAVVGPSGSGKSTLLRAIAGLEPLAGGRVLLDGADLDGVPTHRRGLGLMFQDHALFSHLDVASNIGYGLRMQRAPTPEARRMVDGLLELVGLAGFGRRRIDQLSGGEAQRVALARALAPRPGLLMLDEPLGSLDRSLRQQLTGDLRRLLSEVGQTALHVTHDQAEAFALADRVAVVADGRLMAEGTPAELWAAPGSRFVAEFLGHPNIWNVEVRDDGSMWWGDRSLGRTGIAPGPHTVLAPVPALSAGLSSAVDHESDGRAALSATVTEVTFRDGFHRITAAAGAGRIVELDHRVPVTVGQELVIDVDMQSVRPLGGD